MKIIGKKSGITQQEGEALGKALIEGLMSESDDPVNTWANTPSKRAFLERMVLDRKKEAAARN